MEKVWTNSELIERVPPGKHSRMRKNLRNESPILTKKLRN